MFSLLAFDEMTLCLISFMGLCQVFFEGLASNEVNNLILLQIYFSHWIIIINMNKRNGVIVKKISEFQSILPLYLTIYRKVLKHGKRKQLLNQTKSHALLFIICIIYLNAYLFTIIMWSIDRMPRLVIDRYSIIIDFNKHV